MICRQYSALSPKSSPSFGCLDSIRPGKWKIRTPLPREKGSDFSDLVEQNISETLAEIERLKAQLKANRSSLNSVEKAIAKLETQKAEADAQAAREAQKAKLESAIQNLLDAGVSMDDIIRKLNG